MNSNGGDILRRTYSITQKAGQTSTRLLLSFFVFHAVSSVRYNPMSGKAFAAG